MLAYSVSAVDPPPYLKGPLVSVQGKHVCSVATTYPTSHTFTVSVPTVAIQPKVLVNVVIHGTHPATFIFNGSLKL